MSTSRIPIVRAYAVVSIDSGKTKSRNVVNKDLSTLSRDINRDAELLQSLASLFVAKVSVTVTNRTLTVVIPSDSAVAVF